MAPDEEHGQARRSVRGRRDLMVSLLLGISCLLVYNANLRAISAGDTYPARYLPFAIWHHHTLRLDPVATLAAQGRERTAFWIVHTPGGHSISLYPVVTPVLLAPLYLPAVVYLDHQGWTDERLDQVARIMEKLSASLVAALSASLLYLLLRRRAPAWTALVLSIAFAFGTSTWVISSQASWQHGMGQLLVIGALLFLTGPATTPRVLAAGLLCGLVAGNRPPDAILAAALGVYGLFWAGRRAALFVVGAAIPVGLVLLYNLTVAGHFAGAYALVGKASFLQHDLVAGVGGVLVSPTRGLFVFSPFLLFLALGWRHRPDDRGERRLTLAMIIGVVLQIILYAKSDWRAGISFGPRYMTDLLPLLMWMLVPVVTSLRSLGRRCFVLAVGVSIVIEAIGAFGYTGETDVPLFAVRGPGEMQAAWDWRNAPFIASLHHGLAAAELFLEVRGSIDFIAADGQAVDAVTAGQEVAVAGWALEGDETPLQVGVAIDERPPVVSRAFTDRPDVRATLHEVSPAGWRLVLDTTGLAPGEHRLTAVAWASQKGEPRIFARHQLTVRAAPAAATDADLDGAARTAAARLREHQQPEGYWLTAYTSTTRFEAPRAEMNTFVTALLVDLLGPLEATGDLGDGLPRARRHLSAQIEASGLVRYHGLPDAPGIGTLGCVITPDTDDTALVWRVAPGGDVGRRSAALATIGRYRTGDGLYRSWLAPRAEYQCLDPGSDPNPTDIAIQMHLLLLFADADPAAGRALCDALRPVVDQDRLWVYYRMTPLVPILRLPDLRRAGCPLALPTSRMQTSVPGQESWVSVVNLLGRAQPAGAAPADTEADTEADRKETRSLLRRLAQDDFALLRRNPPLLYHNDLSATVGRTYWSEDVGYALWLRLYHEHAYPLGN